MDKQASEDLAAAAHLADDLELPPRLVAFLAHLAAEKALKSALIFRERPVRRIHDLVALQAALPDEDAASLDPDDVDLLLPRNIAGRYPSDLPDAESGTAAAVLATAGRIVDILRSRTVGTPGPEETKQVDGHAEVQARGRSPG